MPKRHHYTSPDNRMTISFKTKKQMEEFLAKLEEKEKRQMEIIKNMRM